jgi:hypothetical protein
MNATCPAHLLYRDFLLNTWKNNLTVQRGAIM